MVPMLTWFPIMMVKHLTMLFIGLLVDLSLQLRQSPQPPQAGEALPQQLHSNKQPQQAPRLGLVQQCGDSAVVKVGRVRSVAAVVHVSFLPCVNKPATIC